MNISVITKQAKKQTNFLERLVGGGRSKKCGKQYLQQVANLPGKALEVVENFQTAPPKRANGCNRIRAFKVCSLRKGLVHKQTTLGTCEALGKQMILIRLDKPSEGGKEKARMKKVFG